MTEKRFTIKPSMIVDDVTVIIDNQKEYTFPVLDSTLNYMFCKVLNEQHEQIQELKNEVFDWKASAEDYLKLGKSLKKENEQLKTQLNNTSNQRNEFHHGARENANRVGKLKEENKRLKSNLARVIEQSKENDKFLRSDIRILENALWCPNCTNDIKRLKELRKEFLE